MSTIIDKIEQLKSIKKQIKKAINNRGGNVGDDFSTYSKAILDVLAPDTDPDKRPDYIYKEYLRIRSKNFTDFNSLFRDDFAYMAPTKELLMVIEELDTSNVTDMNSIYCGCEQIKQLELIWWNTRLVEDMGYMFMNCINLELLDLTGWDTSRCKNMRSMFSGCGIKSLDLSSFNTINVENMNKMFYWCDYLETLNISSFNTSNVLDVLGMFAYCKSLTEIKGELDLSSCKSGLYSKTTNDSIFHECNNLKTVHLKNIYKYSTMSNSDKWSIDLSYTKLTDKCLREIIDELPNLADKGILNNTAIILYLPKSHKLSSDDIQKALDKGWRVR